jgi:hypothetical protein
LIDDLLFNLETPEAVQVGCDEFVLKGWCFSKSFTGNISISVSVEGVCLPAYTGVLRTDVAKHFDDPAVLHSGFIARFRAPSGLDFVSLLAKMGDTEFEIAGRIPIAATTAEDRRRDSKPVTYSDWIRFIEPGLFWREDEIREKLGHLPHQPLISIILPTYNSQHYYLRRCVESVFRQHYQNWQLCITDDRSTDDGVYESLQKYASQDARVSLQRADEQGGISVASNLSLKQAKGEFVVLLDHDDELHPHALVELIRALNAFPGARLYYSDEDKIDELGVRSEPSFKPDFDMNIFLSFNYLGHMVALQTELVAGLGGFRPSCDGAQDWDLLMRAIEVLSPADIQHISKPLYHWRMHDDSTSVNLFAKPYAAKAWTTVLEDHIKRTAKKMQVTNGLFPGSMRVSYPIPKGLEIAVFFRPQDGIFQQSVIRMTAGRRSIRLLAVTDRGLFQVPSKTDEMKDVASLTELNCDLLVFINGPLESLNHLFFDELAGQAARPDVGLVTGTSINSKNQVIASGLIFREANELADPYIGQQYCQHGYMGQVNVVRSIDAVSERFFAVRRELLIKVGGLSAICGVSMNNLAKELSREAREKGLSIIATPYAIATFSEGSVIQRGGEPDASNSALPTKFNHNILTFANTDRILHGPLL